MTDKKTIQQIIGCLMKNPQLLSEVDKYRITYLDFSKKFERYIFLAIDNLYHNGAKKISPMDIENALEANSVAKTIFENGNGIEYLQDIYEWAEPDNFPYYYTKLKKLNLLRDYKKLGIDTSEFYLEDLTNPKAAEINAEFESLTIKDITDKVKRKLLKLENEYVQTDEVQVESIAEGIDDFFDNLTSTVEVGVSIQGSIYNQVLSGAQPGALTIRSGASGTGKTRNAVADACYLAFPIRYNSNTCQWEQNGHNERVLFIMTEQTFPQIKKMIIAYLTDINESRFKFNNFSADETKRINIVKQLLVDYEKNLILAKIPNPTIEGVKTLVRENCLINEISCVFYDYIYIGPALLKEFKGFNLRDDEVLLMFATALKDLAVELQVAMFTSTQVNANADNNRNIRNEASLAGGRSTINKADNGAIMARPTKEELDSLSNLMTGEVPNLVTDIFKVRSGEWTQVRIWSVMNLGTMKRKDLFITDERLNPIDGFFENSDYDIKSWDEEKDRELAQKVTQLNEL